MCALQEWTFHNYPYIKGIGAIVLHIISFKVGVADILNEPSHPPKYAMHYHRGILLVTAK